MRIIHVSVRYPPAIGGAETEIRRTARGLASAGHAVTVLTTRVVSEVPFRCDPSLSDAEKDGDVLVRRLPHRGLVPGAWGYGARIEGLRPAIEAVSPDVVHAHGYGYDHSDRLARWRHVSAWRLVVSSHGFLPGRGVLRPVKALYDVTAGRETLRRADAVIIPSPADVEVCRAAGCRRIEVARYGLEPGFREELPPRARAREDLGIEGALVLSVGRLAPIKGQDLTLDAFQRVHRRRPDARLAFAGPDGGAGRALRRKVESLGLGAAVRFLGGLDRHRMLQAYAAADVLVHTPRGEPFGIVLIEAMAAGVPVVATGVGGIPFALNGAGVLVGPDPDEIAGAIVGILEDAGRREELVAAGIERASTADAAQATAWLIRLYREILGRP